MIDWLKIRFDYEPAPELCTRLYGGEVVILNADRSVKWQKIKPLEMRGSHDAALHVAIDSMTGCLVVDGNPTKYFQGHNVFGTWDMRALAAHTFAQVVAFLSLTPSQEEIDRVAHGHFEILRIDLTESYACGSLQRARSVLESFERNAHLRQSRHGKGLLDQGTLYYRKHSRRWAAKLYCKGQELRAHPIAESLPDALEVADIATDLLRVEFVVRAMELKHRNLHRGRHWSDTTPEEVFREMLEKLEIPMSHELPSVALDSLPARLRGIYLNWKAGEDVRLLCSKRSFYRYRNELRALGVDIAVRQPKDITNVVPLVQIIELRPLGVPDRFRGTPAYFEPRRTA